MSKVKHTATPGPWVAWFDKDEEGRIYQAGVDSADRSVNIAVTTCENVTIDDIAAANAVIEADTNLIAAAPALLKDLKELVAAIMDEHGEGADLLPVNAAFDPGNYKLMQRCRSDIAAAESIAGPTRQCPVCGSPSQTAGRKCLPCSL